MKRLILLSLVLLAMPSGMNAQTNYYALVTNLWHQGAHTTVVELAQQRLAANTNDIAGLITMAGYDLHYSDHDSYSNVANHVLSVVSNVTTSAFQSERDFLIFSVSESLSFMEIYHPSEEERAENIRKSARPGLFFIYEEPLRLLNEDGYFANDPPMVNPQPEPSPGDE